MSQNNTTSWVFQMIDKVTAPLKGAVDHMKDAVKGVKEIGHVTKFTEKETKAALADIQTYHKDLKQEIRANELELKRLEKAYKTATPGTALSKAKAEFESQKKKVEQLNGKLAETEFELKDINKELDVFKSKEAHWTLIATRINQTSELISKFVKGLDSAVDTNTLLGNVERMTELQGEAADKFVYNSNRIASVYEQDSNEIAKLANAMTKQLGGSYQDNFDLIESGFKRGANLNGDFVRSLQTQIPVLKEMGLSAEQAIAIMTKSAKEGYDPSKVIDSITNAGDAIQKMTVAQEKSLKAIGLETKDLVGKTTFEAVQMVSSAMQGMSSQAKQNVLAKIFGQSGVESGQEFILGLAGELPNLNELPEFEETASGIKSFLSDIKTWAGLTFGGIAVYAQELEPMIQVVSGAIPIINALKSVTALQTVATKGLAIATRVLGVTILGTPIGWILLGLTALIGTIMLLWNKFEGFRLFIFKTIETFKMFGSVIKEYVIDRLKGILSGITGVGKAIMHLFSGEWKKAAESGAQAVDDLLGISAGKKMGKGFSQGWGDAMEKGEKRSIAYSKSRKKEDSLAVNDYLSPNAKRLSYSDELNQSKNSASKTATGMSIGGGSKGIKSIVQTLNITNNFTVSKDTNIRDIADKIVAMVTDRMRDAVITLD